MGGLPAIRQATDWLRISGKLSEQASRLYFGLRKRRRRRKRENTHQEMG